MRPIALSLLLDLLCLFGCGSEAELLVEVRTDLRPADEFDQVVLLLEGNGSAGDRQLTTNPAPNDRYETGHRLPDIRDLARGDYTLTLSVRSEGVLVAQVQQEVQVSGATAVSLLITRDCAGVSCPAEGSAGQTSCHGGLCAPPSCTPEAPFTCPPAECTSAEQCPALSACAEAECAEGRCFYEEGSCGPGMRCKVESGCEREMGDAGVEVRDADLPDAVSGDAATSCVLDTMTGGGLGEACFPRCQPATGTQASKCGDAACQQAALAADSTPAITASLDTAAGEEFALNCQTCVSFQAQSCAWGLCSDVYLRLSECQFSVDGCPAGLQEQLDTCVADNNEEYARCASPRVQRCF